MSLLEQNEFLNGPVKQQQKKFFFQVGQVRQEKEKKKNSVCDGEIFQMAKKKKKEMVSNKNRYKYAIPKNQS